MRVVFISHTSDLGGAERALLELVDGLRERGVDCSVLSRGRGPLQAELKSRRVRHASIPYQWWASGPPRWRRFKREFLNLTMLLPVVLKLNSWKVDVVVTNTCMIPVGALAAFILKKPHIWFIHEFGKEEYGLSYDLGIRIATRMISRLSTFVMVNSKAVEAYYARYVAPERLRTVYNAVHILPQCAPQRDCGATRDTRPTKLLLLGAVHEGKGQMDAVLAVAELVRDAIAVELDIVGHAEPDYLKKLKQAVADLHVNGCVNFAGYIPDARPIIGAADIVLVCSRFEAFGRVTIEAMKFGKPVIGARAGATPELIEEDFNGLLYTPGDHEELARKIKYLIENAELRKLLGENGRRWAEEQFSLDKYAGQVLKILQCALKRPCS